MFSCPCSDAVLYRVWGDTEGGRPSGLPTEGGGYLLQPFGGLLDGGGVRDQPLWVRSADASLTHLPKTLLPMRRPKSGLPFASVLRFFAFGGRRPAFAQVRGHVGSSALGDPSEPLRACSYPRFGVGLRPTRAAAGLKGWVKTRWKALVANPPPPPPPQ